MYREEISRQVIATSKCTYNTNWETFQLMETLIYQKKSVKTCLLTPPTYQISNCLLLIDKDLHEVKSLYISVRYFYLCLKSAWSIHWSSVKSYPIFIFMNSFRSMRSSFSYWKLQSTRNLINIITADKRFTKECFIYALHVF